MTLTIGADPELFLSKDGKALSAYGKIPGTKAKPYPAGNGAVQVDGMALEFNIEPATSAKAFVHNVNDMMAELESMIPKGHELFVTSAVDFGAAYVERQPKAARELGCDPDFNAYTMNVNHVEARNEFNGWRTAGGHVHIGWCRDQDIYENSHFMSCVEMARSMDLFVGLPAVVMDDKTERNKMYGHAGVFRPKPYGVEYRTLSNFWLADDTLKEFVFKQTKRAFHYIAEKREDLFKEYGQRTQDIINRGDTQEALRILRGDQNLITNTDFDKYLEEYMPSLDMKGTYGEAMFYTVAASETGLT